MFVFFNHFILCLFLKISYSQIKMLKLYELQIKIQKISIKNNYLLLSQFILGRCMRI